MITRTVCIDEVGHRYETRTLHKEGWGCSLMNSLRFLAVSFDSFPSLCAEQITGGSNFLEHTWSLLFITGSDRDLARECLLLYFTQTGHQMSALPIDAQSFGAVEFDFFFSIPHYRIGRDHTRPLGAFRNDVIQIFVSLLSLAYVTDACETVCVCFQERTQVDKALYPPSVVIKELIFL